MSQPKVSIIVPVHNAGIYFEKCLISLVNQTLKDIEIILVLDCPTDGSDKIAERYAEKDNRIKLLYNKENLHTGLSRNRGVEVAQGKYIGFLDHDDFCDFSMFELLYGIAEKDNLEVARCNFSCLYISETTEKAEEYVYPEVSYEISDKQWINEYVSGDKISCVIWNHIYRADFLKDNNLSFLDSRKICSEDSVFFMEVYNRMSRFGTIPEYLYCHVFHTSNTGKMYGYRSIQKRIAFFEGLYEQLRNSKVGDETCYSYLAVNMAKSLYSGSRQALLKLPLGEAISQISKIRKNNLVMSCINYLYRKENALELRSLKPTIRIFLSMLKK